MEQYIYIGSQYDIHFFIHTIISPHFVPEISHQIYNMLINDKIITKPEDCVVIYEVDTKNKIIDVISIQHANKKVQNKYDKQNLETFFPILIRSKFETNTLYVITYNYTHYNSYVINMDISGYTELYKESINIRNMTEILTTKEIISQ
jgi:hypothetical protein